MSCNILDLNVKFESKAPQQQVESAIGVLVILKVQRSSKSEAEKEALRRQELENVRQRDDDLFREIVMLSDLSLKMKEVGPDGEKQVKEANDEDVQVLKHESNFDSIC
ncbi:OPA3-like protein [Tanacetum coccineum]